MAAQCLLKRRRARHPVEHRVRMPPASSLPKLFAYATSRTASSSPPKLASYAAGRARRIIFVSPSRGRLAARSATNTQSRSAASTTANFTITAMRPHGEPALTSIPCPSRSNFGGRRARPKSREVVIAAHQSSRRWMRPRRGHVPASQSALLTRLSAGLKRLNFFAGRRFAARRGAAAARDAEIFAGFNGFVSPK